MSYGYKTTCTKELDLKLFQYLTNLSEALRGLQALLDLNICVLRPEWLWLLGRIVLIEQREKIQLTYISDWNINSEPHKTLWRNPESGWSICCVLKASGLWLTFIGTKRWMSVWVLDFSLDPLGYHV